MRLITILSTIVFVSALVYIRCYNNAFTSLNLSANKKLYEVECDEGVAISSAGSGVRVTYY